ncbi:hypothetical protein HY045_01865 [Candidatus Woesebacteria bacterium]|nr:hypothetical protein [Candidatus Woesebacteria bacterium]
MTAENLKKLENLATTQRVLKSIYDAFCKAYSREVLDGEKKEEHLGAVRESLAAGVRTLYSIYLADNPGYVLSGKSEVENPVEYFSKKDDYHRLAQIQIGSIADNDIIHLLINLGVLPKRYQFTTMRELISIIEPLPKGVDPSNIDYAYKVTDERGFVLMNLRSDDGPKSGFMAILFCDKKVDRESICKAAKQ